MSTQETAPDEDVTIHSPFCKQRSLFELAQKLGWKGEIPGVLPNYAMLREAKALIAKARAP